ncbi:ATP-binding cassette domain-containing protein [Actinomyces oris]|uniref:ABC transporter ATP-binding protein n=1 Tax=Actinomyces oris TaxID=544580 RepID=UPI0028D6C3FE|nr:ATP-binding cassette domain-containing protein [Actinomyces oris]
MSGLETRGLKRSHPGAGGERREVLHGVDLSLEPGENVALIGRSGCGKTTLLRALLLLDSPGPEDAGEILLDGEPVRRGGARALRAFRRAVQYVPQDAAATLHPRRSVLAQVSTPLRTLGVVRDREEAVSRARKILEGLEIHREIWENRPHEISGGQAQRVSIARALALSPRYLLLDEPVSGLDPALRRQTLDLLAAIEADPEISPDAATSDEQEPPAKSGASGEGAPAAKSGASGEGAPAPAGSGAVPAPAGYCAVPAPAGYCAVPAPALLVVSHDLAAVARVCQRALVMDEGSIVEDAPMRRLLTEPAHPATRALRDAVPTLPTATD